MSTATASRRTGRERTRQGYLATTTTTVADSDGRPVRIEAGVTSVHRDCDLLRLHPELFVGEIDRRPPPFLKRAAATSSAPLWRPALKRLTPASARPRLAGELPIPSYLLPIADGLPAAGDVELRRVRGATSPCKVRVSRGVRDAIDLEARKVPETHETGGVLIGRRRSFSEARVDLVEAWGPGPNARLGYDALGIDWKVEHARARRRAQETDNELVATGAWHIHPGGGDVPSEADLRMFGAAMAHLSDTVWPLRRYVAIIAGPAIDWSAPKLTAWVVRRRASGSLVCERAVIA